MYLRQTELRMEMAVYVRTVLLLFFINSAHQSPDTQLKIETEETEFGIWESDITDELNYVLWYRALANDDVLLINCSLQGASKPDNYEVVCNHTVRLKMTPTVSESGNYRLEVWRNGSIAERQRFHFTICAKGKTLDQSKPIPYDGSALVCDLDSPLEQGDSLQLHQLYSSSGQSDRILVLDVGGTNSSLEPLVEDLRGRLQVDLNNSRVTLTGITGRRRFDCIKFRGGQCQVHQKTVLPMKTSYVFVHEEENVTLPCDTMSKVMSYWSDRNREVKHMLNLTEIGNFSHNIHSVSQQHAGRYKCLGDYGETNGYKLYVCPKVIPRELLWFSHGEQVLLKNTTQLNLTRVVGTQLYRQKNLEPNLLILDTSDQSGSVPEDMQGRTSVSADALFISNVTAEDSGVYTWRVFGWHKREMEGEMELKYLCAEGRIHLLYKVPFGVASPFYRAFALVLACMLLGLVAFGIWVNVGKRKWQKPSEQESREEQQSEMRTSMML